MPGEIAFLEKLGELGNQNPSLNWLSYILLVITFSVDKGIIWIVVALVMLFFKKMRKCGVTLLIGSLFFSLLFNNVLIKLVVQRQRPYIFSNTLKSNVSMWMIEEGKSFLGFFEVPRDYSFLSGHSFSSFLSAGVILCYHKKIGIVSLVYASLVAFSRLYFGVHYPSDVIFGSLFGFIFGIITYQIVMELTPKFLSFFKNKNETN